VATQFASRLALIAFFVVSVRGLMAHADFEGTLRTALIVVAAFYVLGWLMGYLAQLLVEENARAEVERLLSERLRPDS